MSKTPLEFAYEIAQECVSKTPVLILGSGASAAYGIPNMLELQKHLLEIDPPASAKVEDKKAWNNFLECLNTTDLETALDKIRF